MPEDDIRLDAESDGAGPRGPARAAPRVSLFLLADIFTEEGDSLGRARVRNLSVSGMMAECGHVLAKDDRLRIALRGIGEISGRVVWAREGRVGVLFDRPINPDLARKPVGRTEAETVMPDYLRPVPAYKNLR